MNETKTRLKRCLGAVLAGFLSVALLSFCSHGRSANPHGGAAQRYDLKKKVMLLPILDLADAGQEAASDIYLQVFNLLSGRPGVALLKAQEEGVPPPGPHSSVLVNFATDPGLIKRCEDLGIHALVGCVLNPVESTVTKSGFWPFRYTVREVEISFIFNVVEVHTEALYLTRLDSERVRLPLSYSQGRSESEILERSLKEAIPSILKRQKSQIIKKLAEVRWFATIRSVEGDTLAIDAGHDLGIRTNQTFWVYGRGEKILGKDGRALNLPGKRIGEVRVREVSESRCTAAVVSGGPFSPGQRIVDVP